jgi:hypothetical protein
MPKPIHITLALCASETGDCASRLKAITCDLERLASGPDKHLPAYQSRADELAADFAALRRLQRDLLKVSVLLRPLIET